MGEVELDPVARRINIHSTFIFYGESASPEIASQVAFAIAEAWNEPQGHIHFNGGNWKVHFHIEREFNPQLQPETVWYNSNPRLNFFRIEDFADGNISFVDGIGSNTGYFKADNLLRNSTTAAHEYGHTIGLLHPVNLDIRGMGQPGIMYPRGTICDPDFQYDPWAKPLAPGGTLNPASRKVLLRDIENLRLEKLRYRQNRATLGEFTNMYHTKHEK